MQFLRNVVGCGACTKPTLKSESNKVAPEIRPKEELNDGNANLEPTIDEMPNTAKEVNGVESHPNEERTVNGVNNLKSTIDKLPEIEELKINDVGINDAEV
jgi:hypothetical protein